MLKRRQLSCSVMDFHETNETMGFHEIGLDLYMFLPKIHSYFDDFKFEVRFS